MPDAKSAATPDNEAVEPSCGLSSDGIDNWSLNTEVPGQTALARDARKWRALLRMAPEQIWFLPTMVVLALLASLFEGIGLTLIVPLIQSLGSEEVMSSSGYLSFLDRFFTASMPAENRTASLLGLIFAAVLLKAIVSYANVALLGVVYGRISHRLRVAIFERVVSTPLATLERQQSGKLLNTINNETWRAADAINLLFSVVTNLSTAIIFITLLLLLDWKLALLALGSFALIPPVVQAISCRAKVLSKVALESNEALTQQSWSTINGLRTIHTFGREDYEQGRFGAISNRVRHLFLKLMLVRMWIGPITEILTTAVIAVLVLLAGTKAGGPAVLIAFVAILYRLQPRIMGLAAIHTQLASIDASVSVVGELLGSERGSPISSTLPQGLSNQISFHDVTFRYGGADVAAIEAFSFEFPRSGIIAIVGASGAGKSTLLDLILGFQFPQSGEIRVGGHVLTERMAAAWRRRIGVVNQDPYIFDDTVRANILYGRPDATDTDMVRAAEAVGADQFIRTLPLGYNTPIGERATQISGGQKQRIALARALLRDPELLLLDEATNALDWKAEGEFQVTLKRLARDRTIVVVAHKFSTVEIADHVIVLQNGRIDEQGRPADLAASGKLFTRLFVPASSPQNECIHATEVTSV